MLRRADPKLIGAFVVGAMVLAVVGLVFFGRGGLLTQHQRYILYFDRSVKGLSVGAPVTFRGVRIGSVSEISVHVDPRDYSFKIPVTIDIEPRRIEAIQPNGEVGDPLKRLVSDDTLGELIAKGLRGQLQLQSLITGQLFVQLDLYPETEVVLSGYKTTYPEIPTIPSGLDELSQTLENLPVQEIADQAISTLQGLQELVHNPDLADSLYKLNHGLDQLRSILATLNRELGPALRVFRAAADRVERAADSVDAQVTRVADRTTGAMDDLSTTLERAGRLLARAEKDLAKVEGSGPELQQTLTEMHRALRSLRLNADKLDEHPDRLLRGRGQPNREAR